MQFELLLVLAGVSECTLLRLTTFKDRGGSF